MFNLDLYPLFFQHGIPRQSLPGLIAINPPKKCGRGRESDQLIALVHPTGKAELGEEGLSDWLQKKAALFYSSPGSVTNAMRLMAEAINNEWLERNLKKAADGVQVNGSLYLAVLRKDILYTMVIGQGKLIVLQKEGMLEQVDRENHPRGLGINQSIECRFQHTGIEAGFSLLLAPVPSVEWTEKSLHKATSLATEALLRRLLSQRPSDLKAALVQVREGKGNIQFHPFPVQEGATGTANQTATAEQPVAVNLGGMPEERDLLREQEKVDQPALLPGLDRMEAPNRSDESSEELVEPRGEDSFSAPVGSRSGKVKGKAVAKSGGIPPARRETRTRRPTGKQSEEASKKPKPERKSFFSRKGSREGLDSVSVPRSLYLLLAIVIPLVVVAIAASVYINQGKSQQFDFYYREGQKYSVEADLKKDDPVMYSFNLQAALMYLQKAAEFGSTADSRELLTSVQQQLDQLQGVVRLPITPLEIAGSLGAVNISQIVAMNTDLYLLDSISGKGLHYSLVGSEYVKDENFDCGPNPENPLNSISKLVDIVSVPAGPFEATIFAIDAYGNFEFCIPGKPGATSKLIAPDAGWQEIRAVTFYQNYLFVLDPGNNAVFRYTMSDHEFKTKPILFFDKHIPDMTEAVDFEVNGDELYLLRSNGEMVECTYSAIKEYKLTECEDPAPYSDPRAGGEGKPVTFPDAQFIQMKMTAAPDSSLYLLDAHSTGIYHFSLQRNLQKIYQPGFNDPEYSPQEMATSMALSPGKTLFLGFGSEIFTSKLP